MRIRPNGVRSLKISSRTAGSYQIQVELHDRELNDAPSSAPLQQNLAAVDVPLQLAIEDFHKDGRMVELLHRNRHVTIVNQKPLIGFGSERRRDVIGAPEKPVDFGKKRNEISELIRRIHVRSLSRDFEALCCIDAAKAQFACRVSLPLKHSPRDVSHDACHGPVIG